MNVWKIRPLALSRKYAGFRATSGKRRTEDRMDWVRLQIRNETKRLKALTYLGPKWVLYLEPKPSVSVP